MKLEIDYSKDSLLDEFSLRTLEERYMVGDEKSPQEAFARAAEAFADDEAHAQRLYDYVSKQWFMFATPLLSNGGTQRGLPISCFLNYVDDSREGITEHYTENAYLSSFGGGIGGSWTRKWSKEPCFGYVKHFYDFDPATQEFTIWKPAGIANSGYILYTQPIAAWKWDLLDEVKIPNTTGSYGLLTDDPNFPTTNAGTRLVGYPFGTNYSFGPKKRDPATGSTYAGRGVWPMWFAYMSTYDVKYIDSIDTYTDLPTKPQPFAVKTTFN